MKTLPNSMTVFNATPHPITFWDEGWDALITVEPDAVISATIAEVPAGCLTRQDLGMLDDDDYPMIIFVTPQFVANAEGCEIIQHARSVGADLVVGSIIAAQAYPGEVVAMTPIPGYERVPPAEKRMNPYKFTVFLRKA